MMKLFEAKWRQFINEEVSSTKTAYFFDFDETLAFDKNPTYLYFFDNEQTADDPIAKQLQSKEEPSLVFDAEGGEIIDPSTGEQAAGWVYQVIEDQHTLDKMTKQFDNDQNRHRFFFDYSRSRIVNEPTINVRVMNIFLNKLQDSQNNTVCILTARGSDVQDDLMNLFDDLLRQKKRDTSVLDQLHIFTLGSGEYGTRSKGEFMAQYYRENPEVQNVAFYEDSETNLAGAKAAFENPEFRMMLEERGGNAVIYKVVHGDPQVYLTV